MAEFRLEEYLEKRRVDIDAALDRALPAETAPPEILHRAMRYAVLPGGKRLRPTLVLAGAEAAGGRAGCAIDMACSVELIHAYSLVHDDLPALDDDDLRRGRPTLHRAFDEATAILAGDALLTVALDIALGPAPREAQEDRARRDGARGGPGTAEESEALSRRVRALRVLVSAIGPSGMIGGQVDDLLSAGRGIDEARVRSIHERKTGALLRACPVMGATVAGADEAVVSRLDAYGGDLGLAFQIIDDILDIEGTAESLGKSAGKDAASGKATFPAVLGLDRSRSLAEELAARAAEKVRPLGPSARPLEALAAFVVSRRR